MLATGQRAVPSSSNHGGRPRQARGCSPAATQALVMIGAQFQTYMTAQVATGGNGGGGTERAPDRRREEGRGRRRTGRTGGGGDHTTAEMRP